MLCPSLITYLPLTMKHTDKGPNFKQATLLILRKKSRLMRSRCCLCVCLCIPPIVPRLGKNSFIVIRQRLDKNHPIVARQRFGRNVTAVTNTHATIEEL
jgi:hypothetical protein